MMKLIRSCRVAITGLLLLCTSPLCLAHDIAGKATVLVYVKPQGTQLVAIVRVPLEAMGEVTFPVYGPGYLDFARADSAIADAAQMYLSQGMHFFADGVALPPGQIIKTRVALPADKSFVDFATAWANVNSPPLANDVDLYWKQAHLDVVLAFPIASPTAKFAVEPQLNRIAMETHTVLRFLPQSGEERIFQYTGNPGRIELEPSWWYASYRFTELGFFHILDGIDHLLFLLCLVIPVRSIRALIPVVTAFTIAHSITLICSALGFTPTAPWFAPLIETLIALSVFYMACENILGIQVKNRWMIVFAFGLIHGFGFSFILADRMQFAGTHLVSSLLAFNVGVELGQLLVLIVAVPLLDVFFKRLARVSTAGIASDRIGAILLSVLVAHTAWHWLSERGSQLLDFPWQAPTFDAAFFAAAMRWAMLVVGSVAVLWLLNELYRRFTSRDAAPTRE